LKAGAEQPDPTFPYINRLETKALERQAKPVMASAPLRRARA